MCLLTSIDQTKDTSARRKNPETPKALTLRDGVRDHQQN
jgi:hypothetical protein